MEIIFIISKNEGFFFFSVIQLGKMEVCTDKFMYVRTYVHLIYAQLIPNSLILFSL